MGLEFATKENPTIGYMINKEVASMGVKNMAKLGCSSSPKMPLKVEHFRIANGLSVRKFNSSTIVKVTVRRPTSCECQNADKVYGLQM